MHKTFPLTFYFLIVISLSSMIVPYVSAQSIAVELWSNPLDVVDLAVSRDGNYIAVVNNEGIYLFNSTSSVPRWWYNASVGEDFRAVSISGDGSYVAAGNNSARLLYFNSSNTRLGKQTNPTWTSQDLGFNGLPWEDALDMSDDGNYVVCAQGSAGLFDFANCTTRSGYELPPSRVFIPVGLDITVLDINPNCSYIATGGSDNSIGFYALIRYADLAVLGGGQTTLVIQQISISDDAYALAAVDLGSTTYYWHSPTQNWTHSVPFGSVDVSADGDEVVAGSPNMGGLYFWSSARGRTGEQPETWTNLEGQPVYDVAISNDGRIIAATSTVKGNSTHKVYFLTSGNITIGEFDISSPATCLSMSGNGHITASGSGDEDSLHVFALTSTITANKWNDLNHNGVNDAGEPEIAGWKLTITCPNKTVSTLNSPASWKVTESGNYTITEELQTGWVQTTSAEVNLMIQLGDIPDTVWFGNHATVGGEILTTSILSQLTLGVSLIAVIAVAITYVLMKRRPIFVNKH